MKILQCVVRVAEIDVLNAGFGAKLNPAEIAQYAVSNTAAGVGDFAGQTVKARAHGQVVKHVAHLATTFVIRPVFAMFFQAGVAHCWVIGSVAMKKHIAALTENIGVDGQVGSRRTIGFQSGDKAAIAIVVALNKVKIAARIAANEVVDPANSMADRFVGARQSGPAKIENIAAEYKRFGMSRGGVDCRLMPWRLGTARAKVKVGQKIRFHGSFSCYSSDGNKPSGRIR